LEIIIEKIAGMIFGLICHQDSTILMSVDGRKILLCPRCMGLHLGFISSFLLLTLWTSDRTKLISKSSLFILAIAIGSMAIDWGVGGYLGLFAPTTFSRLATGLASGSALSALLISYRRGMLMRFDVPGLYFNSVHIASLVCFSVFFGIITVTLSSWIVLTTILLLTVITNITIVVHTLIMIIQLRLLQRAIIKNLPHNQGGFR